MKIMNVILATLTVLSTTAFASSNVTIQAGDSKYTSIPACGYEARVKAVYSKVQGNEGHLVLRFCNASLETQGWCGFPVLLNTNRDFEVSGDGKTEGFYSLDQGRKLNGDCVEFQMHNPTGTERIRSKIGTGNNSVKITIE